MFERKSFRHGGVKQICFTLIELLVVSTAPVSAAELQLVSITSNSWERLLSSIFRIMKSGSSLPLWHIPINTGHGEMVQVH